jgi:hypothetical protein
MKRIILAFLFLATPAMAQQRYTPLTETLLHQAEQCEVEANTQIGSMSTQIATLTKQVADDKVASEAAAKADPKPVEPAK